MKIEIQNGVAYIVWTALCAFGEDGLTGREIAVEAGDFVNRNRHASSQEERESVVAECKKLGVEVTVEPWPVCMKYTGGCRYLNLDTRGCQETVSVNSRFDGGCGFLVS